MSDLVSKHDIWRKIEDNAYWVGYDAYFASKSKGMTLDGINQALNEVPEVKAIPVEKVEGVIEELNGKRLKAIAHQNWTEVVQYVFAIGVLQNILEGVEE